MSYRRHTFLSRLTVISRLSAGGLVCALVCLLGAFAHAQEPEHAEQRLARIRQELGVIASERRQLESRRGAAAQQLRRADEQVSAAARALRQIEAQLRDDKAVLEDLQLRRASTDSRLGELRAELARLVRRRYIRNQGGALKQFLAPEPGVAQGARVKTYHDYLQHYLQERIATLQDELTEVERLEGEIVEHQRTLKTTFAEQRQRARELERERQNHAQTQELLDSKYASHSARERALGQDARALEALLLRLRETEAGPDIAAAPPLQPGTLDWPLSGSLVQHYGQPLADGRSSAGLLIDAPLGAPVRAVAEGTVVFSEWMTGYGMLLILDHGHGKLSLYAHNESLLKQEGDAVRRGEVIASVGRSGGQNSTGLYFELRDEGRPVNPERWLQKQGHG